MDLRLPTQEEWIKACLAGGPGPYAIGARERSVDLDGFAWLGLGPKAGLQRVAYGKKPSYWGLYDMHGNAAEWVNDFYDASTSSQKLARDPTGPATGRFHVVRGSSWRHGSITELRLSFRDFSDSRRNDIGFRIARYVQASK